MPTAYESALISKLAYVNPMELTPPKDPNKPDDNYNAYVYLQTKGWKLKETVHDKEYFGYIWVNESTKQIVISHRGSQNLTSWLTDIESVVQSKVGDFISSAVNLLSHPTVLAYRAQGFRLKSVGHSLGGFLAQVLVFWSKRQDFPETYYPNMSADVFDSPGVVEFIEDINSNIVSEKDKIKPSSLSVHNYCSMPTLVSTYGTQTGTLWHLPGAENETFAFVNDHRMVHILKGFDQATGQPRHFRQMSDWPQADYSNYESPTHLVEHLVAEGIKAPFTFLNYLYKKFVKRNNNDTAFDQLFRKEGQVEMFLREPSYRPDNIELGKRIFLALKSHYLFKSEKESKTHIALCHFDQEAQVFLSDLIAFRSLGLSQVGLDDKLKEMYGQAGHELLSKFSLNKQENKVDVVISDNYEGNIFKFQNDLQTLLSRHGTLSIRKLFGNKINEIDTRITTLSDKQSQEANDLRTQVESLRQALGKATNQSEIFIRSAIAEVEGANAFALQSKSYSLNEARKDISDARPGFKTYIESALARKKGANAVTIPADVTKEQVEALAMLGVFNQQQQPPSPPTLSSAPPGNIPPSLASRGTEEEATRFAKK